jgi:hypothetical protein
MLLACGRQRAFETLARHWMKTYDRLFKVPISGQASADGFRDTDEFFMRAIDQRVDDLLARWKLRAERLVPEERDSWARLAGESVLKDPEAKLLF